ncbi:DUF4382 domain-containing protein, partial [Myxococcota bacterium]|nr:DUF4382 domain-containing protein [Myxococcota bacterium]
MNAVSRLGLTTLRATIAALGLGAVLTGCGAPSSATGGVDELGIGQSASRLRVALTSSSRARGGGPARDLQAAMVRIDRVTAHTSSTGWVTIRDGISVDVDVLRLGDSAVDLGFGDLPPGKISQIRLHVDGTEQPYVVTADGTQVAMKVPSGEQSGLKVKGVFTAEACGELRVNVDLDGPKSIHIHPTGKRDLYVLRPVIKASGESVPLDDCPTDPQDPGDGATPPDGAIPPGDGADPGDGTTTPPGDGTTDPGDGSGTPDQPNGGTGDGSGTGEPGDGSGTGTTDPG